MSKSTSSPKRSRSLAAKLILLAASVFGTLVLIEVGLRWADYPPDLFYPWAHDPEVAYKFAPNLHQRMAHPEFDIVFQTNSAGYRDHEIGPKSGFRIVLLGDSFAAGYGVAKEKMFPEILEQALGIEIVNIAVGGHELIHHLHYLRTEEFKRLEADLVLHTIYLGNDLTDNEAWESGPNNTLHSKAAQFPVREQSGSKLWSLLKVARFNQSLKTQKTSEWQPGLHTLSICTKQENPLGRSHYQNALRLLIEIRKEAGPNYLPVFFGFVQMVDPQAAARIPEASEYDFSIPERVLAKFFTQNAQEFINLNPSLRTAQRTEPLYYTADSHWNPAGHALVAKVLAEPIKAQVEKLKQTPPAAPPGDNSSAKAANPSSPD